MFIETIAEDALTTWRVNRPERRNAIGWKIIAEWNLLLEKLEKQCEHWKNHPKRNKLPCRLLQITASPISNRQNKTWIAGGDLYDLAKVSIREKAGSYANEVSKICQRWELLPIPVIVSIDGDAIGGGAELALAGDFRFATEDSRLIFKQLQMGLTTGYGGCRRLVEYLGRSQATQLLLGSKTLSAEQALSKGLLSQIFPSADHLQLALLKMAQDFALLSPEAVAAQKSVLIKAVRQSAETSFVHETEKFQEIWRNPCHTKKLENFLG